MQYPGIEQERKVVAEILNGKQDENNEELIPATVQSHAQEGVSKEWKFMQDILVILKSNQAEQEQKEHIEKLFLSTFGLQRLSWKTFYRTLGLAEEHFKNFKEVDLVILKLLILIKQYEQDPSTSLEEFNNIDHVKKSLKYAINGNSIPGVKFVGKIHIPESKKKDTIGVYSTEIEKQEETTDPIVALVGKNMSVRNFLSASNIQYHEIDEYIETHKSVPARYFGSTKTKKNTIHFFTIGEEHKMNNDVLINISLINGGKIFEEGKVYEIVLLEKFESDKRDDPKKQSYNIRGILKEEHDKYHQPSMQVLGEHPQLQKLSKKNA